jgi:hypothetical protein
MSAEPQEGSANAFARLMRPQTTSHSITSPTIIRINDGSSEGSTATDTCPDFSSAYIVKPNSSSCPSQFNSVEEHFVISKRTKGANRTYTLSAQCSFCGTFFAITNQTKMRIHLTGEREGQTRVAACGKIPPSCRQYYLDKKASNQIAAAAKLTHHRKLLQEVIDKHAPDLPSAGQKRVFESDPSNARCLTAAANLPNGQLTIMTVKNIAAASAMNLAVVRFLAASGVPPHVVELDEFKDLVQSIQAAPNAKVGGRQSFAQGRRGVAGTWLQMASLIPSLPPSLPLSFLGSASATPTTPPGLGSYLPFPSPSPWAGPGRPGPATLLNLPPTLTIDSSKAFRVASCLPPGP